MVNMNNEQRLMESVNYINELASRIQASEEEQNVSIKLDTDGFKGLNENEREILKQYVTGVSKITYTAEFMKHAAVVAEMYDPSIRAKVKDIDWSIIEKPLKNQKEMSEFEIKKALKDLKVFEEVGNSTGQNNTTGFDENGRPYATSITGDLKSIFYFDTFEYELKEA
jgi:hypothetical protein